MAARCIGRQPGSNVWVISENVEISEDGRLVNADRATYVYIKGLFEGSEAPCTVDLPLSSITLWEVVSALMAALHHNGMASIFTIGKKVYFSYTGCIKKTEQI
jgi:hypothetical protein